MKAMTVEQIAYSFGYKDAFVREACERAPENHPLPHIKRGSSRPVRYIQPRTFEKWLEEEERRTVGVPDDVAKGRYHALLELLDRMAEEALNEVD